MRIVVGGGTAQIPGTPAHNKVIIANTGASTIYFGWEPTVTSDPSDNQGIPLAAGNQIIIDSSGLRKLCTPIYVSGPGTVNYTFET